MLGEPAGLATQVRPPAPDVGRKHGPLATLFARHPDMALASEAGLEVVDGEPSGVEPALVCSTEVNRFRHLNEFFSRVNARLETGGLFAGVVETISQRKTRLGARRPGIGPKLRWFLDFVVHRILPRLSWTRGIYWSSMKRVDRALSLTETLGRLVHSGFEIVDVEIDSNRAAFLVRKSGPPMATSSETIGLFYSMERVGKDERPIRVHKIRTMHPYAQYLQAFVFSDRSVAPEGKFNNDFRVTRWGRFLRRYWFDELPMLINWLQGDLKIFGVRPISKHYLSLYPEDVRTLRARYKPGLIPPYYADLPKGLDEIVESERKYLTAYERQPLLTDIRYFVRAVWNIVVRSARSS